MSQPSSEERNAEQKSSATKRKRSPIERIVVWVLILGLAGLVGVQYMQRTAYEKDLGIINDAISRSTPEKRVPFEEIQGLLSKKPEISETNYGGAPAHLYTFAWKGLKEYRIELVVSKETGNVLMLKPLDEK